MKRICIFCGSRAGTRSAYREAAREFGRLVASQGVGVVYGGGSVGLMGALADAALEAGGEVIGVIPRFLTNREIDHRGVTAMHVVDSMHERKAQMAELADAFVMLPGGVGTYEEFIEAITWAQLGLHVKPCGVLNVAGYYDAFFAMLDHAVREGFIQPEHRAMLLVEREPAALLAALRAHEPREAPPWTYDTSGRI